MQEVFVNVSENDQGMIENLRTQGFEDLGEESGVIIFLKEQEEKLTSQRKVQ